MSSEQSTYRLDCGGCGIPINITNPRLKELPLESERRASGFVCPTGSMSSEPMSQMRQAGDSQARL